MCGIYGILSLSGGRFSPDVLERMGKVQRHRGPDDSGTLIDGDLMFGMQRLAIIDIDGGHQPISNEAGDITTVCNGEIYNYRELRNELKALGYRFRTDSDSEVVIHLYAEYGDSFVERLSGMFGVAVWDARKKRLLIARDRLGIKPLYIRRTGEYLAFSSELKSLLEIPGVERRVDLHALEEYLSLGYVPAPMSLIQGIEKLNPATLLIVEDGQVRSHEYFQYRSAAEEEIPEKQWVEEIATKIEESVVAQMVSDVPLGAFLSGGVDSSAVVAFMAKNSDHPVKTYSIGFDTDSGGKYYNELPYARRVSELFSTEHQEIIVRPDVTSLLPSLLWHLDEPIADGAFITTYLVSKFAREGVTVILSGVGGDELFGGYRRYWGESLVRKYKMIPQIVRRSVIAPIVQRLPADRHSTWLDRFRLLKSFVANAELENDERYENFIRVFKSGELSRLLEGQPDERSDTLIRAFERASTNDELSRLIEVDLTTQLPDDLLMLTDRMSMAASLECRVPLLDDRLLELAARVPSKLKVNGTRLKVGLKDALRGVLPDDIIDRKKRGFGAPIGAWFKKELEGFVDMVLSDSNIKKRGLFCPDAVGRLKESHRQNREDHTDHLLSLVNFELWCQLYLDGNTPDELTDRLQQSAAA